MRHLLPTRALPLVPAALGLAAPALAPAVEGLFFQPRAETVLTRTTTWSVTTETTDIEVLENGEPSQSVPAVRAEVDSELTLTTIDRHVRAATNQPLELVRTYDEIGLELEGGLALGEDAPAIPLSGEGESELEGIAVHFEYDPDTERWKKRYAEDYEGREELLEPLRAEAEFLGLLPGDPAEVEVGDRWEIDLDRLEEILVPGGHLPLERETELAALEGVLDPMLLPGPFELLDGDRDGEFVARLEAVEDGVAVIALELDVEIASDQQQTIVDLLDPALPEGARAEVKRAPYLLRLEGKGTLRWDLEAYHARSLTLTSDVEIRSELSVQVDIGGDSLRFDLNETRAGELRLESGLDG